MIHVLEAYRPAVLADIDPLAILFMNSRELMGSSFIAVYAPLGYDLLWLWRPVGHPVVHFVKVLHNGI